MDRTPDFRGRRDAERRRRGPGWWMDADGTWRPPQEWPEDTPPLAGWVRVDDAWKPPVGSKVDRTPDERDASVHEVADRPKRPQLQIAEIDSRPPLLEATNRLEPQAPKRTGGLVKSAIGVVVGLTIVGLGALVAVFSAGASSSPELTPSSSVLFANGSLADQESAVSALVASAPSVAGEQLAGLDVSPARTEAFNEQLWTVETNGCVSITEEILAARSAAPVTWLDEIECVLGTGSWTDDTLGLTIDAVLDVEVQHLVSAPEAHASGGADWTAETRSAYLHDTEHPPSFVILHADGGHNPRGEDPSRWRPADRSVWCGYAIDWVAVKSRWSLSVTDAERRALAEMLETCNDPGSDGAFDLTRTLETVPDPEIRLVDRSGE